MKNVFGGIVHVHFPVHRGTDCENGKACASVQFLSERGRRFYSETICCPADVEIGG